MIRNTPTGRRHGPWPLVLKAALVLVAGGWLAGCKTTETADTIPYPYDHKQRHPITFDDLVSIKRLSDAQISPDGKEIAYVVAVVDKDLGLGTDATPTSEADAAWTACAALLPAVTPPKDAP